MKIATYIELWRQELSRQLNYIKLLCYEIFIISPLLIYNLCIVKTHWKKVKCNNIIGKRDVTCEKGYLV